MNCFIWGGLQFARVDAPIEISCRSLGHGIEDEDKLEEGTEAGGCHSPEVTHQWKHCVAHSGNGIEESILTEGTEAGDVIRSSRCTDRSVSLLAQATDSTYEYFGIITFILNILTSNIINNYLLAQY